MINPTRCLDLLDNQPVLLRLGKDLKLSNDNSLKKENFKKEMHRTA